MNWLKENPNIRYVVLGSPFMQYVGSNTVLVKNDKVQNEVIPTTMELAETQIKLTLDTLRNMGVKPIVFAPPPSNDKDIGHCLMRSVFYDWDGELCRIEVGSYKRHQAAVLEMLSKLQGEYEVVYVSDYLCKEQFCNTKLDGVFIYRDAGHLSIDGSQYLGEKMDFYKIITSEYFL